MRTIIIILLACLSGFAQINQYGTLSSGIKNVSGTTLPDMKGSANGTLINTPVVSANGYISFLTASSQRIDFTRTTFDYQYNSSFSETVIFRSSKADANGHALISNDNDVGGGNWAFWLHPDETAYSFTSSSAGGAKEERGTYPVCDGKWHILTFTYSTNNWTIYYDGKLITTRATDQAFVSGNLYQAISKYTIGAQPNGAGYLRYLTGDIRYVDNTASTLSAAAVQNKVLEFKMLLD